MSKALCACMCSAFTFLKPPSLNSRIGLNFRAKWKQKTKNKIKSHNESMQTLFPSFRFFR